MGAVYQEWDQGLIDYQLYRFHDLYLRGPSHVGPASVAFLGAAQTFGRFCFEPFPAILERRLGVGTVNCGVGGKGPRFFLESEPIMNVLNNSRLAVVQVMSARSVSNSVFAAEAGGRDGIRRSDRKHMTAEDIYRQLLSGRDERGNEPGFIENLFAETRRNYVNEMIALLHAIRPPKILFWFSVRSPGRHSPVALNMHTATDLGKRALARLGLISRFEYAGGHFPHLVDRSTIAQIVPACNAYVQCVTSKRLPQILVNRQRKTVVWNNYYPTAAMHNEAADALLPVCRRLLGFDEDRAPETRIPNATI